MRHILAILWVAVVVQLPAAAVSAAPLHLEAGDSYVFEATGFVPSGFDASKVGLQGFSSALTFGPDILTYPERIHAEYYEDVLGGQWWMKTSIGVLPGQTRSSTGDGVYYVYPSNVFSDFQGVVYLWMETGSVDVQSVTLQLAQNGLLYERTFALPIPEPHAVSLIGAAAILASGRRRRRKRVDVLPAMLRSTRPR